MRRVLSTRARTGGADAVDPSTDDRHRQRPPLQPGPSAAAPPDDRSAPVAPDRVLDPDRSLGPGWRRSTDRVVTTSADETGLHVLVADTKAAYQWRTAATLAEPGMTTDQWTGQLCVTGSGRRAVVVYAPRQFANKENLLNAVAFSAAVVDLSTGAVTKLPERYSLAYHNPGCAAGESVVLTRLEMPATANGNAAARTVLTTVDTRRPLAGHRVYASGQLTSAVPVEGSILAAKGDALVTVDRKGTVRTAARTGGTPFRLMPDESRGVAFQVARTDKVDSRRYRRPARHRGHRGHRAERDGEAAGRWAGPGLRCGGPGRRETRRT